MAIMPRLVEQIVGRLHPTGVWEVEPIKRTPQITAQLEQAMQRDVLTIRLRDDAMDFKGLAEFYEANRSKFRDLAQGFIRVRRDSAVRRGRGSRQVIESDVTDYKVGVEYTMSLSEAMILLNPASYGCFFEVVGARPSKPKAEPAEVVEVEERPKRARQKAKAEEQPAAEPSGPQPV